MGSNEALRAQVLGTGDIQPRRAAPRCRELGVMTWEVTALGQLSDISASVEQTKTIREIADQGRGAGKSVVGGVTVRKLNLLGNSSVLGEGDCPQGCYAALDQIDAGSTVSFANAVLNTDWRTYTWPSNNNRAVLTSPQPASWPLSRRKRTLNSPVGCSTDSCCSS